MLDFIRKKSPVAALMSEDTAQTRGEMHHEQKANVHGANKLIHFCLYALLLLVPIFYTSFTSEALEFNKQNLLFLAVVVMLGAWVVKVLTTRHVSWVKTSIDYLVLAYLAVYAVSSFTSIDKVSSFLGYHGRFTGSLISVVALVLLYFLLVNNLQSEKTVRKATDYLAAGMGLGLVLSLLQLLGAFILPGLFTHNVGFNPVVRSLAGLSIFAAISIVYFQWMMFFSSHRTKLKKWTLVFLTLVGLVIMILTNAFVGWLVLGLSMVAFMALSMTLASQSSANWFWKPLLVLVIAVLFVAFQFLPNIINPRNLVPVKLPVEIQLSNKTTWSLVKNSLTSGFRKALIGSGPGTTGIAFGDIKPTELNKSIVWSLTFDRASSEIANLGIETGLLGLIVFELMSILFLVYALFHLIRKQHHPAWGYSFGFFMLWLSLYIAHFFYFFNTVFYLLFWLGLAGFMATAHMREAETDDRDLSFSASPRAALSWMFVSLLVMALLLVGVFFEATIYGGEVAYASGLKELAKDKPDFTLATNKLARAISFNPYRDVYYLALGQDLIFQVSQEAAKQKPDTNQIQSWISDVITAGQKAVDISPEKASNWQALAQFYASIKPLASGVDKFVIQSLQTAISKDSNNPALHYQLGQAYFAAAASKDSKSGEVKYDPENMKNAEAELNKAIDMKSDLPEFYIQLSRILVAGNKAEDAKKKLDQAVALFPTNPDVLFEDGVVTYNQKNYDDAQKLFSAVIQLVPNHANAHYSLGLIYQQKGDKANALAEFEKTKDIVAGAKGDTSALDKLIDSLKGTTTTK